MHIFEPLIHAGGILHIFKNIPALAGIAPPDSGWEFLKRRYVKVFSGSLEVRGGLPGMTTERIRALASGAVALALEQYGDMLVGAQVRVAQGRIPNERTIRTGYHTLRDGASAGKKVVVEIVHDPKKESYSIAATAHDHVIDGVPLFLLLQLIHHHIIFGEDSLLKKMSRTWKWSHEKKISYYENKSAKIQKHSHERRTPAAPLIPAGAFIDVTESAVTRLRNSINADTGVTVPTSLVEESLLAMLLELDYLQDCVSRHGSEPVAAGRYDGLGFVRMQGLKNISQMPPSLRYAHLCPVLSSAAQQVPLEREGRGKVSVFLKRYRRVPLFYTNFFDRRTTKEGVIVIAGHELMGSNLNGVDFGIPLCRGGITADNIRFTFMPSHAEHSPVVFHERIRRGRDPHITLFSLGCAPATMSNGRKIVFKSIKTARMHAEPYLLKWGYSASYLKELSDEKIVSLFYNEIYSPGKPAEGRLEKLAESVLQAGSGTVSDKQADSRRCRAFFLTSDEKRGTTVTTSGPAERTKSGNMTHDCMEAP